MENIKVLIQSQNDIDYCADLFFKMGYRKGISKLGGSIWIASFNYDGDMYSSTSDHTLSNHKQLTIEQLRDLVHSKKKSENEKEMNILDEGRYVIEKEEKHSHYKKDVSGLDFVDVYRVLRLFEVADPCLQHAVKKLLCSGQRGVKDEDKDIQEAIDSLLRYREMKKEDLK